MTFTIRSAWPAGLRTLVLTGVVAAVVLGWALGAGTASPGAGVVFGAVVVLLVAVIVVLFHHETIREVPGAVAVRVDADGVYLSNPPRRVPWSRTREVLVYELRGPWSPQLAVRTDADTEVIEDLLLARPVDVAALRAAVREHAPGVPVTVLGGAGL